MTIVCVVFFGELSISYKLVRTQHCAQFLLTVSLVILVEMLNTYHNPACFVTLCHLVSLLFCFDLIWWVGGVEVLINNECGLHFFPPPLSISGFTAYASPLPPCSSLSKAQKHEMAIDLCQLWGSGGRREFWGCLRTV